MFKRYVLALALSICIVIPVHAQTFSISSPGSINEIQFNLKEGIPTYSVKRLGTDVILDSRLGLELQNRAHLDGNFRVENHEISDFDETWEQVWGEKRFIRNQYRELRVDLAGTGPDGRRLTIVFRAFDDGIGFRYEVPGIDGPADFNIMDELTEFALAGDHQAWYIKAYQWNRYEYLTRNTPVSVADTVQTPITMKTANGLYLSIHQAALTDYSTMTLERTGENLFKANLIPWADGVKVRATAPMKTPWRTIQISDNPAGLITSHLILNLNEPNKIEDTSWIEPAKYVGIWWGMHLDKYTWSPGEKLGATTENAMRYIDFAAKYGFRHVLVEGWNPGWDDDWFASGVVFDFTRPIDEFDLEKVAGYAREKGLRLMGHHETSASVEHYEGQMEEAFALYESLGVRSVKTGYVGHGTEIFWTDENGEKQYEWHHGQHMVRHHQKVVELAARHKIALNVHEGLMDTGLRRTWPNLMTREVARGQEYNAWGESDELWAGRSNPPDHVVTIPFTRMLAGPFDYTPGVLQLTFPEYKPDNRVNHTTAKELALYVIIYSPLQMAADLPENYENHLEPFRFIRDVPTDWYDTRVLHADIGNYLTIVRKDRNSDDWYLGSITDEYGRVLEAPLHFLDPGRKYTAMIYRDGDDTDWETNPFEHVIEEKQVTSADTLILRLAPGGGQAIRFVAGD